MNNGTYDFLKDFADNNENYKKWQAMHTKAFGTLYSSAFEENEEAKIHLTAALNNMSERKFLVAMPKLRILESITDNDNDEYTVNYFYGLNFEFMGNEAGMQKHYEKLSDHEPQVAFNLAFHPYYRTAKIAQRDSECKKAVYYYRKALEIYDSFIPDNTAKKNISLISYELATAYIYIHDCDNAERFLELSERFDPTDNPLRNYTRAVLYAIRGNNDKYKSFLELLPAQLKENCIHVAAPMINKTDPHRFVIEQSRITYPSFVDTFLSKKDELASLINEKKVIKAEKLISEMLTRTFPFMLRRLDCKIEKSEERITVRCKNYYVKTLIAEHSVLFSSPELKIPGWEFVSVNEFSRFS
ncbi:MAG: hypothetical protein IJN68_01600 [Clostridia bacterium]|nr:hypothetical protein [Clostridia bacterium]